MNRFYASACVLAVHEVAVVESACLLLKADGRGSQSLDEQLKEKLAKSLGVAGSAFKNCGLKGSESRVAAVFRRSRGPLVDASTVAALLGTLKEELLLDLNGHTFIRVREELSEYVDNETLFGRDVAEAFPSANEDIKHAGNCLAADCPTAAVFHLMRAAEVALRALAADRQVEYPDAPLENKQWGNLLAALDGKLGDMRKADWKYWPSKEVKDAQITFYHSAVIEFRDFNEAWRRHVSHARAWYDDSHALNIFNHVKKFMVVLSSKVSEKAITPAYWTSP